MQHEYQLLVREQHICGAQVHVDVPDRDVAVQVVRRVAPYLPTLLAISASSPYWRGQDTGYASYRSMVWSRWPTAGPPGPRRDRRRLRRHGRRADRLGHDLRRRDGLLRHPAERAPAHRRAAGVRRLPGRRGRRAHRGPLPRARRRGPASTSTRAARCPTAATSCCARAAGARRARVWRATSSTSTGDKPQLVAPQLLIGRLVHELRPQLEELGDWEQVLALSEATLTTGSAAARQRRTFGRRGELTTSSTR